MEAKRKFAEYVRSRKGWNCTVVDGFNEYELGDENRLSSVTFYQPKDTAAEVSKTDTVFIAPASMEQDMDGDDVVVTLRIKNVKKRKDPNVIKLF